VAFFNELGEKIKTLFAKKEKVDTEEIHQEQSEEKEEEIK
jgi:hypothetical protein